MLLVNGYLLAPLFLIVPLMVCAVLAADAFAGEKERRTLESLLHLPIADRDLFVAKLLVSFVPALAVSWLGFIAFAIVANGVGWPVVHRIFIPTQLWMVMILWVAPAVAALGLGVMVRVSARALDHPGGQPARRRGDPAADLPGHGPGDRACSWSTCPIAIAIGAVVWVIALWLIARGAHRFSRDRLSV